MTTPAYAGIGSRQTPEAVLHDMAILADSLETEGFTLRSGGAFGADDVFEKSVADPAKKEIFIPWNGFSGRVRGAPGIYCLPECGVVQGTEVAAQFHPGWDRLSPAIRKLMIRNSFQVLGRYCDQPSRFVLCWTPEGKAGGGTGQAIRIAHAYSIPVFDLGGMETQTAIDRISDLIGETA